MSKIKNPVVLIHKRENSDSYAVAITCGSQNYHDAVLMASMELDMSDDDVDTWSKTGYYMAQEIERLKQALSAAENNLIDSECLVAELSKQRITHMGWSTHTTGNVSVSTQPQRKSSNGADKKKGLTITLPDITSKAFWSGTGKNAKFHPETYKRWVKEAIKRDCVIAGIGVEVK